MRRRIVAIAVVAAAVALGVGVAEATIPDAAGVIHGCYTLDGGTLRLIDPGAGQTCSAGSEAPLDWNITGGQGATGPVGPQGVLGPPGARGAPGADVSSGYERVSASFTTDGSGNGTGEADCANGKLALSGGVAAQTLTQPTASRPTDNGGGWTVTMKGSASRQYTVYAICVTATAKGP